MRWPNVHLVFRRELRDMLRDRRTVFLTFVLPIVLYPVIMLLTFYTQMAGQRTLAAEQHSVAVIGLTENDELLRQIRGEIAANAKVPEAERNGLVHLIVARNEETARAWIHEKKPPPGHENQPPIRVAVMRAAKPATAPAVAEKFTLIYDSADERSAEAARLVRAMVQKFNQTFHKLGLENKDIKVAEAVPPMLAGMLVYLLVIMSMTGAYYPAVDLVAGEKERGTIETLLCSPAARIELVLGKFLTVMVFSCITSLLNLGGMALTLAALNSAVGGAMGNFTLAPAAILYLALLLVPVAALFSALALALSSFARSSKEAQLYMTPMMVIGIVLCMPALGPLAGTKLATPLAIVPVTGPCLALVTLMTHSGSLLELPWAGLAAAFISTYAWAALAIRWATRLFNREAVLFRESEAFDLRLWIKHVLGRPRTVPRPGDAAVVFIASLLLFMLVGPGMQAKIVDGAARIKPMGLVLSQILLIAGPALLMAGILRVRSGLKITNALSLRAGPVPWLLPIVPLIAVAAWIINQLVVQGIVSVVPGWGETAAKFSQQISGLEGLGLPAMLAIFAVTPAICEDLLVRGFILAGMTANAPAGRTPWKAIIGSGALFGVMHALGPSVQLVYAFLLGIPMAWLVWRTRSLLFGILFHMCFNGVSVLMKVQTVKDAANAVFAQPAGLILAGAAVLFSGGLFCIARATKPRSA